MRPTGTTPSFGCSSWMLAGRERERRLRPKVRTASRAAPADGAQTKFAILRERASEDARKDDDEVADQGGHRLLPVARSEPRWH